MYKTIPRYKTKSRFMGLTGLIATPSATVRATVYATVC